MSAYKRGDRWHVRFTVGGQPFSASLGATGTRADAVAYEAKIRAGLLAGTLGKTPERTIDDALAKWLEGEASQLKSYENLLGKVRAVMAHTSGIPLEQIADVAQSIRAAGFLIRQGGLDDQSPEPRRSPDGRSESLTRIDPASSRGGRPVAECTPDFSSFF